MVREHHYILPSQEQHCKIDNIRKRLLIILENVLGERKSGEMKSNSDLVMAVR